MKNIKNMEHRLFLILLAFTTLMMVGCKNEKTTPLKIRNFYVLEMDSCEYIRLLSPTGDYYGLVHKGNCRFCKERRQKELKELVEQLKEK